MIQSEILAKANKILQEKADIKTCLQAKICPSCGNQLSAKADRFIDWLDITYTCQTCNWTHTTFGK